MSEQLTISCDRCHERVAKASRTRIKWSSQPDRREPMDLCPSCRDDILEFLGMLPPQLSGLFPAEAKAAPPTVAARPAPKPAPVAPDPTPLDRPELRRSIALLLRSRGAMDLPAIVDTLDPDGTAEADIRATLDGMRRDGGLRLVPAKDGRHDGRAFDLAEAKAAPLPALAGVAR